MSENSLMSISGVVKFRAFWASLSRDEQKGCYDIMTALRGPDVDDGPIVSDHGDLSTLRVKMATTAKIRALLLAPPESLIQKNKEGESYWPGGFYINRRTTVLSEEEKVQLLADLKQMSHHFINHALRAFNLLVLFGEEDSYLNDVIVTLSQHVQQ